MKKIKIFKNLFPLFLTLKDKILIISCCIYKTETDDFNINEYAIKAEETFFNTKFIFKKGIKIFGENSYINFYKSILDFNTISKFNIHNQMFLGNLKNMEDEAEVIYNSIYLSKFIGARSCLNKVKKDGVVYFVRQAGENKAYLTIKKLISTDYFIKRILIFFAFGFSKIIPSSKKTLLFEKELNGYGESASVLYEKLIDKGYNDVCYIINKNSEQLKLIKEKYKKNIIYAQTFKHYFEFFRCNNFIGTEAMGHAIDLRTVSRLARYYILRGKYYYTFLQHGVMYMISLDTPYRSSFRKGDRLPKNTKIVASSKLEAEHFIDLGGFDESDLYVTGLPKFDKAKLNKGADKIVIMPTWREWESNLLKSNYKDAGYYKMLCSMLDSIPDNLKDKVYLLPHNLFLDALKNTDLNKYIPDIINYDLILRDCKLLITDYSSISYDAFYRGSNVIFWWKDKEDSMKKMDTHLMLNEKNVFGDICNTKKELRESIEKNYYSKQPKKYINKYRKIVEFNDNKNTERLIKELKKDGRI